MNWQGMIEFFVGFIIGEVRVAVERVVGMVIK